MTPPIALLPVELATLGFLIYRIIKSKYPIERLTCLLALFLHLNRFLIYSKEIFDQTWKNFKISLFLFFGIIFIFYNLFTNFPIGILLILTIFIHISGYYFLEKTSTLKIKKIDWKFDLPITILSLFNFFTLYKAGDRVAIIWLADVFYHLTEFSLCISV